MKVLGFPLKKRVDENIFIFFLILSFVYLCPSLFSEVTKRDFDQSLSRLGRSDAAYFEIFLNSENKDPKHARSRELAAVFRDLYLQNFMKTKDASDKNKIRIPKIIHQIWLGSPVPDKYQKFMQTWAKLSGWKYQLWTDEEIKYFPLHNQELYDNARNYGEKSDILRYEILYRQGGIYADTDFECVNPQFFEFLHQQLDFYAGIEPLEIAVGEQLKVCNALIACKPGHPLMKNFILGLHDNYILNPNNSTVKLSGPDYITQVIFDYVRAKHPKGIVFFPCTYFYPLMPHELSDPLFPESAAVHYWGGSWK